MQELLNRIAELEARITKLEQTLHNEQEDGHVRNDAHILIGTEKRLLADFAPSGAGKHPPTKQNNSFLHPLRTKCSCGGELGDVRPKGGQYCVYCVDCNKYQYNVPKKDLEK